MTVPSPGDERRSCSVCGGEAYESAPILWDGLVEEWGLSPEERAYIDRQQGERCAACGCSLRSIALARALLRSFGYDGTFAAFVKEPRNSRLRVLELNGAGNLTPWLRQLPGWRPAMYPEVDMQRMPFADGSFDVVVHSDTLEHVPDAIAGLRECGRVLAGGGVCAYTVPVVVGRLTRGRAGLPPSYHGAPGQDRADHLVHWEFGADAWVWPLRAGFDSVEAFTEAFPAAVAWAARKRHDHHRDDDQRSPR